ncbi:FtsX-like permease family protein [Clostridium celatum]|uniref:Efflux ABC transporter, permease protein n=1 Tax=Clostridium celatum DSM 1785 TaxID=545697 RepID=L1QK50_9CLOT|nr:FtsX-like permease family protein [Clostridium celatum]EKY28301.1 efflux ABC transporter, permease protein [Clostridium celatum DSM 1785]MCE9655295.1 FtsX-like permease family protein [Clostridium celatum]
MYFKLAFRNIKKSLKDYAIYFLTLVLGVCIFYTFNSIESQSIMMELSDLKANAFELTSDIIGIVSIFISFILGFLIIYANNYLIKRRKKEFGIYMTLGMENSKLSIIIFIETILIGMISLGVGLILGILLSQGISIVTAKLFEVNISKFQFVFSKDAFLRTIANFGIIYLVVLIFNSIIIRKVKLIDLLNASKKNEKLKVKNIWGSIVVFLISIISICTGYHIILKNGLAVMDSTIIKSIIFGTVGTFLFFFSLSGFLLKLFQSNKKNYFKNLNMFVLRQINSKVNTTFISMSFICLMLFVAICTFSAGLGITKAMNSDIEDLTQFDASFWSYDTENVLNIINEQYNGLDEIIGEKSQYTNYESDFTYKQFFSEEVVEKNKNLYPISQDMAISIIKLLDFNSLMKMLDKNEINLKENEYYAFGDISEVTKDIQKNMDNGIEVNIDDKILVPSNYEVINVTTYDSMMKNNICTIVVNDEIVNGLKPVFCNLNINFKSNINDAEKYLNENFRSENREGKIAVYGLTKNELLDNSVGIGAMISYLAIYMGIVFLITSAAVLALQQLSESADNVHRYKILKKIGVDDNMINKSLLTQIGIYFIIPLSLAIVHSIVGLKVASDLVSIFGSENIQYYILCTAVVLVVVYGGYFIATYNGSKKIIKTQ